MILDANDRSDNLAELKQVDFFIISQGFFSAFIDRSANLTESLGKASGFLHYFSRVFSASIDRSPNLTESLSKASGFLHHFSRFLSVLYSLQNIIEFWSFLMMRIHYWIVGFPLGIEQLLIYGILAVIRTALIYLRSKKNEGCASNWMLIPIKLHWIE